MVPIALAGKSGSHQEKKISCDSEAERDAASTKLGVKPEITRFKGQGKNTPEHKDYIVDQLVVPMEE